MSLNSVSVYKGGAARIPRVYIYPVRTYILLDERGVLPFCTSTLAFFSSTSNHFVLIFLNIFIFNYQLGLEGEVVYSEARTKKGGGSNNRTKIFIKLK